MTIDQKSTYYDVGGIEVLEIIRAKLTEEQFQGYVLGNLIKYSCRLNWKGQADRDAEKIGHYAKQLGYSSKREENITPTEMLFESLDACSDWHNCHRPTTEGERRGK